MPYLALARKWRPQQFDEVLGQEHISRTLLNAIAKERIGHAYLFAGPRGIGKTTLGRILAKALNCLQGPGPTPRPCDACSSCKDIMAGVSLDVLEIDGASNRGIDAIRELRETVRYAPSSSRFKIYIIDEVHMLTTEAFNALLKTLEEPPPHVKFFFATTDPHKLPPTILSRCQRFDLKKIPLNLIEERLRAILREEGVSAEEGALKLVAEAADGGMRDAESILDQLLVYCGQKITAAETANLLGLIPGEVLHEIAGALGGGEAAKVLELLGEVFNRGWEAPRLIGALLGFFRDLLVVKAAGPEARLLTIESSRAAEAADLAGKFSFPQLDYVIEELIRLEREIKFSLSPRATLEMTLVKLARRPGRIHIGDLIERLAALEKGCALPAPAAEKSRSAPGRSVPAPEPGRAGSWEEAWGEFIEALGRARPVLKTHISLGRPAPPRDGVVEVFFEETHGFYREALENPRNKAFMENLLEGKLGGKTSLKFTLQARPIPAPAAGGKAGPAPEKSEPGYNPRQDPKVLAVLDRFEGTVVGVEKGKTRPKAEG